ncbi:hypothetical protein [Rhizobium leguminosarum]|uniref:hypothetical protein n=1 Tax=Rhizobium leguminosarum TaxID=384 RepID=UPI003F980086
MDTAQRPSQLVSGIDFRAAAKLSVLYPSKVSEYLPFNLAPYGSSSLAQTQHTAEAVVLASEFYQSLPASAHSDALWDVISLAYAIGCPTPLVDVIDGMTTVDFSAPGRLLSVLIDENACHLSSFSQHKELKMTYVSEDGVPRDEFTDVLWGQLRDFRRPVKA